MKRERAPKKVPKTANLEPVIVEWLDAHHDLDFDGKPEDATEGVILHEYGCLVRMDKKYCILGNETYEGPDGKRLVRGICAIPASLVQKITYLEPRKDG